MGIELEELGYQSGSQRRGKRADGSGYLVPMEGDREVDVARSVQGNVNVAVNSQS